MGLTATAATTVIACGSPKNSVVIKKTALKDLHLKTRLKNSVKNQQAAFDSFIELNPEVNDLRDAVQVIGFIAPDYNQEGSLEVQAKTNTKYSGTLTITVPELNKTDLARLMTNTTIQGTENMTADQAFQAILAANSSWTNLSDYVEADNFTAPDYTSNGSLTINAKPNTEYTGSILVTITAIGQTSLNDLNLKTLLSMPVTNSQAAFDSFIELNPEVSDLRDNLEITSFTAPDYNQTGSLTVAATRVGAKYTGTLTITIPALNKTDLARLVTNTIIQGTTNMTTDQAFQAFLEANNSWSNLGDYVEVTDFTAPDYGTSGSLTINAKPNTEYIGSITIVINAIGQKDLGDSNLEATIAVDLQASETEVFQAFLDKNQSILGNSLTLDQVELTAFEAPQILANGKLTITAKTDGTNEWTGSIEVTIKYILSDNNFSTITQYLSNQGLLKFQVLAGTKYAGENNLFAQITNQFIGSMGQYYELGDGISDISIVGASERPGEDEMNEKGLVWHKDTLDWINLRIRYLDGRGPKYIGSYNVHDITIATV